MHCASLGEFEQGRPVLESIKKEFPKYPVVVSFFSPSGYEVRKNYPIADRVIYLPIDTKKNANSLIHDINPAIVLWVKYEYWQHYLFELKRKQIPVLLISGIFRNSQPFFQWHGSTWRKILHAFEFLFLQNQESLTLLHKIGIQNSCITGDTRFDRVLQVVEDRKRNHLIEKFINNQFLIVAGSTWENDEIILQQFSNAHPACKFIIVPHEVTPSNINRLLSIFSNATTYSDFQTNIEINSEKNILIVDAIGILSQLYAYGKIAYVGGGFGKGIHNTLEPAVYGIPVVFGPNYQKFSEAVSLIKIKAAFSIANYDELKETLERLMNEEEQRKMSGDIAKEFVTKNQGATAFITNYVTEKRLLTK